MSRFTVPGIKKPKFQQPGGYQLPGNKAGTLSTDAPEGEGSDMPVIDYLDPDVEGEGNPFGGAIDIPGGEGVPKDGDERPDPQIGEGEENHQPVQDSNPGGGSQSSGYQESDAVKQALEMLMEMLGQKPGEYAPGDAVQHAYEMLQEMMGQKPGEYQSQWQEQLAELMDRILNREEFSYDLNGDALYQQYKDQYMLQGQQAMMDTMGQAAAMTGGFGNSYAQTVGQQTYQGYLQQLNDKVPELYQLALDKYHREGDEMYRQFGMLSDQENQDYNRHRDSMNDWRSDLERMLGIYYNERDFDYGQHRDNVSDWQSEIDRLLSMYFSERDFDYGKYRDDREYAYREERDQKDDEQWQREFDESKRRWDQENPRDTVDLHGGSGSGSGGNGRGSGGGGNTGSTGSTEPASPPVNQNGLTEAAQAFVDSLPYPSGGASSEDWKNYVLNKLRSAALSEAEKEAIAYYLGL